MYALHSRWHDSYVVGKREEDGLFRLGVLTDAVIFYTIPELLSYVSTWRPTGRASGVPECGQYDIEEVVESGYKKLRTVS